MLKVTNSMLLYKFKTHELKSVFKHDHASAFIIIRLLFRQCTLHNFSTLNIYHIWVAGKPLT